MNETTVFFGNSGDTIAAERKLIDAGMEARIAPNNTGAVCGICLVVNSGDMGKVRLLLGDSIREIIPSLNENSKP
jgi:hypothetical protein